MIGRPQVIGRYRINRVLGHGAMGTVYLAQDPLLMRPVAIKVLRDPDGDHAEIMTRFQREAVISARLNHPHVITVFDVGTDPAHGPFMAMEYVDGVTLTTLIREKPSPETGLRLLAQTMSALVASESEGIAHRDVKPDNILVGKDWRVKLMDFGIARSDGARLTQAGQIFGTPYYTAPEVLVGGEATFISDRYSFAVTAFEVLTGSLPFHGSSVGTVVYRIVHEPPVFPPSMSLALRAIFAQALSKNPKDRYRDLFSFMEALIEATELSEEIKPRLRHYVSEVRAHASEPPMGITQSLEPERTPDARTTAMPITRQASEPTLEFSLEEEDPFDGPSYQTVVIPPMKLPTLPIPVVEEPPVTQASPVVHAPPFLAEPLLESWIEAEPPVPAPPAPEASVPQSLASQSWELSESSDELWMGSLHGLTEEPEFMLGPPPSVATPLPPAPQAEPVPPPPVLPRLEVALPIPEVPTPVPAPVLPVPAVPAPGLPAPILPAPIIPAPVAPAPPPPALAPPLEDTPEELLARLEEVGKTKPLPVVVPAPMVPLPQAPASSGGKRLGLLFGVAGFVLAGLLIAGFYLFTRPAPPAAAQALFVITSTPDGATVFLDGKRIGSTPLDHMQPLGVSHSLRVEMTGYQPETRAIQAGESSVHVTLKVSGFTIAVASDPPGADVFLNGQSVGTTPIAALTVPFKGPREIVVSRPGYEEWRAEVDPDLPFPDRITLNPASRRPRKR